MSQLTRSLLDSREVREALRAELPEIVAAWAGSSRLRRMLARPVGAVLASGFDPADGSTSISEALTGSYAAEVIGETARILALGLGEDPVAAAERLREPLRRMIEAIDFGDVREAAEATTDRLVEASAIASEELWRHPAKVLCLLSAAPVVAAGGVRIATRTLGPVNQLAPDLVADVALSLLQELSCRDLAALLDQVSELVRKLHTGAALIGEERLADAVANLVLSTLDAADVEAFLRARALLDEIGETAELALLERLDEQPQLARALVGGQLRTLSAAIRRSARRLEAVEGTLDESMIAVELDAAVSELDSHSLAALITTTLARLNQLEAHSPGTVRNLLSQVVDGLDPDEVAHLADWLGSDLPIVMEPLAPDILPPLLHGLADLISSAKDDRGVQRGLESLRAALEPG